MKIFEENKIIETVTIEDQKWAFRISEVFNPSDEEIRRIEEQNDNCESEDTLSINPHIFIVAESQSGEVVEMWWCPVEKVLGPHISKRGWSKGLFSKLKGNLANWKLKA